MSSFRSILWLSEITKDDADIAGGKAANLGEMMHTGLPVPEGFVISSTAYFKFLKENNLTHRIKELLSTTHTDYSDSLMQVSAHIKKLILHAEIPHELIKEIDTAYHQLGGTFKNVLVAVRSSGTADNQIVASSAGLETTFLNVHGEANLILKIREAWASLFEPRAILYRHEKKLDHFKLGIAIVIQKMVEAEKSGVMFTLDPVTNHEGKIVIEAIYGLGELITQGKITPDHYEVAKRDLSILKKSIALQETMLEKSHDNKTIVPVPATHSGKQKITDNQIMDLALLGKKIEKHYYFPQDVEWAIEKNNLYILETRAITTLTNKKIKETLPTEKLPLVLKGSPASPGIVTGHIKIIHSPKENDKISQGEILVTTQTTPDYLPAMKKAAAIITDKGGRTSHAAIISRELGIPAVVGTEDATKQFITGLVVTVNGTKGEVYKGSPSAHASSVKTATKIYADISQPSLAPKIAQLEPDGVGILRAESIIRDIGVHPKKLIKEGKGHIFVDRLTEQIGSVCKIFAPHPVWYRTSDLLTTDYKNLTGGKDIEPNEANPLLGFHGAYRWLYDHELFMLEAEAVKQVRNNGIKNLSIILPFVRTTRELIEIKKLLAAADLHRSPTFKLWIMADVPATIIMLEKFIAVGIDGIAINPENITSLLLGIDKENSEVSKAFDELNPAVLWLLEYAVKTANKHKIQTAVCGNSLSLYPTLLEKLVSWGVNGVTVSPDTITHIRRQVAGFERKVVEERFHHKSQ